MGEDDSLT